MDVIDKVSKYPFMGCGVARRAVVDTQYGRVLLEIGMFGLIIFFLLIGKIFQLVFNRRRWAYKKGVWWMEGVTTGFIASFVGLLIHGLSGATFILIRPMIIFWFTLAMMSKLPQISPLPEQPPGQNV